jgi:protein-disulfide isomerase
MHDWAELAARAGICISQQSPAAFWKFHDFLFPKQTTLTDGTVASVVSDFVTEERLSNDDYSRCIIDSKSKQRLDLDLSEARSYGVSATPTVFVNGKKYLGFRDEAAFATAVNLAAKDSDKREVRR